MVSSLLVFSHVPRLGFIMSLTVSFVAPPTDGMSGNYGCVWIASDLHDAGKPFPSLP